MAINVLILADRSRADFGALPVDCVPALLPVCGKSVIDYCLEDIREAGIHQAHILVREGDPSIYDTLGDGARLGLALSYIETYGVGSYVAAGAIARGNGESLLVIRGDMLRGHCIKTITDMSVRVGASAAFYGDADRSLGVVMIGAQGDPTAAFEHLAWERLQTNAPCGDGLVRLCVSGIGVSLIDSLSALHSAFQTLLEKRFAGLQPGGRFNTDNGTWVSAHAEVAATTKLSGAVRIGLHVKIHSGTRLTGTSDIGDLAVVDRGAEIVDSLVMPGTYVGRGARLKNSIVWGPWLYRADLNLLQKVDDPLLLDGSQGLVAADQPKPDAPAARRIGSRIPTMAMLRSTLGKFRYFGRH